jgi:predicted metalloprotease with PDZ domain
MASMLSLALPEASQDKSIEPLERISLIRFLTRQEPLLFRMQLEPTNLVLKLLKIETQLLGLSMSQENHLQAVTQTIKKSPKPRTMFHKQ